MKKSVGARPFIFPYPVFLVGTYDDEDVPNLMTASWGGICCSEPPCINVSLRKATYSYNNIINRKAFTIAIPSKEQASLADYFGITSGKNNRKFEDTGLTEVRSELVDAPYAEEFPMVLECKLKEYHDLGLHTIFIGEIMDVKVDEEKISPQGKPDIQKVKPFLFSNPERAYFDIGDEIGKAFSIGRFFKS